MGTNSAGNDAFFVREDYASRFVDRSLQQIRSLPSRFRESRDVSGRLTHLAGVERLTYISALPVVNVETSAIVRLADLKPAYSDTWLGAMTGITPTS